MSDRNSRILINHQDFTSLHLIVMTLCTRGSLRPRTIWTQQTISTCQSGHSRVLDTFSRRWKRDFRNFNLLQSLGDCQTCFFKPLVKKQIILLLHVTKECPKKQIVRFHFCLCQFQNNVGKDNHLCPSIGVEK